MSVIALSQLKSETQNDIADNPNNIEHKLVFGKNSFFLIFRHVLYISNL